MSDNSATLREKILNIIKSTPTDIRALARQIGVDLKDKQKGERAELGRVLNELAHEQLIISTRHGFRTPPPEPSNIRVLQAFKDSRKDITYETFIGVVDTKNPDKMFVQPANSEGKRVPLKECKVPDGTIVTVQVAGDFNSAATIIHDHGHIEQESGLSKLSALSLGIPLDFPEDVMDGTPPLTIPKISKNRKDYRHIPFLTIDPETAKDFDDAICVRKKGKNWQVMVAVADVSHYVRPGTKLFEEAYRRGNSTYLPDLTIPMLPSELSDNICSLRPNEDRAAIITTMTISPRGEILKSQIERGVIQSRYRLNYEQVQEAIEGRANKGIQEIYNKYISKAYGVYQALLDARARRGALDLDVMEQHVHYTKGGKMKIIAERGNESHGIIEEIMIAANRVAIDTLIEKGAKFIARVHGKPNDRVLNQMFGDLKKLGVKIPPKHMGAEAKIEDILRQARNNPNEDQIRTFMIRAQEQAFYSNELSEHHALKLEAYTHKTSPIRRMTDLYIDMLLVEHILGGPKMPADIKKKMGRAAKIFSMTERRSMEADRETTKRHVAKWLQGEMGNSFNACVTHVGNHSIKVKVEDPQIISEITVSSPSSYSAGDNIRVTPTHADQITGVVQFGIERDKVVPFDKRKAPHVA